MKRHLLVTLFIFAGLTPAMAQTINTIAGNGTLGYSGDGGPATAASFYLPQPAGVDKKGRVYTAETGHIRMIDTTGIINTIAGHGTSGYAGDGGPAAAADVMTCFSIISDNANNIYISQGKGIRKIDTAGVITTIAGTAVAGYGGDGGPAIAAQLNGGHSIAFDDTGNLYIAEEANRRIRKVNTAGIITTIAGTGTVGYSGDGGPALSAELDDPFAIATDHHGNIYFCETRNSRIRKIDAATGIISTIAGSGPMWPAPGSYTGDGGPATLATFQLTAGIAIDDIGNIFVSDMNNNVIRKINNSGIVYTVAGTTIGFSGDGGPAILAQLRSPKGLSIDDTGNLYIADWYNNRIRKISTGNHLPFFTGGHIQTITMCQDSARDISSMLGVTDADAGQPLKWVLYDAPLHGTATVSYSTTSTGGAVSATGIVYTPTAGYVGNDTFRVRIDDTISADFTTIYVTVNPGPYAGSITGDDTVCEGDTLMLSAIAGGIWSSSGPATVSSSGIVTAGSAGTAIISYTVTNGCGSNTATHAITVMTAADCGLNAALLTSGSMSLVWPNPSTGTIMLNTNEDTRITITNCLGQKVKETNVAKGRNIFMQLEAPDGIYFVNACGLSGCRTTKIILKQ